MVYLAKDSHVPVIFSFLVAPSDKYPNGARQVFHEIRKKEGFLGFYRGTTAILFRAFPANAACFLGYEIAMKTLNQLY